ncbi:MAG: 4a-hydroxytetrahydrobiopterin dehydratase [Candidatus Pacearchaeota archaeon]
MVNIPILDDNQIQENLKETPLWKFKDKKIIREFKFKDFKESLNFIDLLIEIFEEMDHYPDIKIKYNKVIFELSSYFVSDNLTEIDFILAKEIDRIYEENY